jgi:hypothetical protein
MDTSNRLAVIFDSTTVDSQDLQPEERVAVVLRFVALCKPKLHLFRSFRPIQELFNTQDFPRRITDLKIVEWPEGVEGTTRVMPLVTISPSSASQSMREDRILLTRKAELVFWSARYELRDNDPMVSVNAIATTSRFSIPNGDKLKRFITSQGMWESLETLCGELSDTIRNRDLATDTLRALQRELASASARINFKRTNFKTVRSV